MPAIDLYTRSGCHLCEEAHAVLERVRRDAPFELRVIDIDGDPALRERFGTEVPVVFVAGRKAFKYRIDESELRRKLAREAGAP